MPKFNLYAERCFNFTIYSQSRGRIHRPGKTEISRTYQMVFDKSTLHSVDYSVDDKTPVMYQHVCSKCGHKENYDETYPRTSYRYND